MYLLFKIPSLLRLISSPINTPHHHSYSSAGEWQESCSTLTPSGLYMYELAQQHRGLLVNVEHRFYGDSFPFADSSTAR